MPRKPRPAVVSSVTIGFIDVIINGKSIFGGGASYKRTEYADGTVKEVGGPAKPTSISDALRIASNLASEELSETPATAGSASARGRAATSGAKRRSARCRPAGP